MRDVQHVRVAFRLSEIEHRYGDEVHILADPLSLMLLGKLCARDTIQPEINRLLVELYRMLMHEVIAAEFPRRQVTITTRMIEHTERGVWTGEAIDPNARAVVVALARAGLVPSQIAFDYLNQFLEPKGVRQDHLVLGRQVDRDGHVTGAAMHGAKIGGGVDGAVLLIPDPMGATGSTITRVLEHYRAEVRGQPLKTIAVHCIVTPEYLRHVRTAHPEVVVYALRLDRGLSDPEILDTVPGTRWAEERGLNEHHYIVPGGGGFGEIINNSFV
ncbi:MAG TPA: uracil phosphoribosyltransferase [Polyangia bacterium]|jgi:uracil phosphoribosyltransferase